MATDYLLDTHAFLWWASGDLRLPLQARALLDRPSGRGFLSIVTPWEIAIKVGLGKLPDPGSIPSLIKRGEMEILPVDLDHVATVKSLPMYHRDPFDRMLIAQALAEDMTLVSNEAVFDRYGVRRVWD